jgi:penicillin-binding protein 2
VSRRASDLPEPRRVRFRRAAIVLVGGIALLFAGVARLQLGEHQRYRDLAERNWLRLEILRAPRGRIFDTNGVLLTDNAPSYCVQFRPAPVGAHRPDTLAATARSLVGALLELPDSTVRDVVARARHSGLAMPFRRNVSYARLAAIEERLAELPGVEVQVEPRRAYPESTRAAHLLGYAGEISAAELETKAEQGYRAGDLVGRAGLERSYETELRGNDGRKILVVNASGRRVGLFEDQPPIPPVPGHDLVLTLDVKLQRALEEAMREVEVGAAVALDPQTGGVLALVSRPSFDPNEFARGLTSARWREVVNDRNFPLLNRAVQSAYPPGSTFKVVTSLAGLGEGVLDPRTRFAPCGGGYWFGGRYYRCWRHSGHGSLSLREALAHSCDVYYYQAGMRLGVQRLHDWARRFHLGEKTGIDLPHERKGLVPDVAYYEKRKRRPGGAILNLAIGQGELLCTPLQLALIAAASAMRGAAPRPHLVRAVVDPVSGATRHITPPAARATNARAEDWESVVEAMESVVAAGTGALSRVPGVRVAGKTGTAQNPHGEDHALYIAFAPVEAPRIALAVVVENGGHGGSVAAPVAGAGLRAYLTPTDAAAAVPAPSPGTPVDSALILGD